jgi:hypothetical protein
MLTSVGARRWAWTLDDPKEVCYEQMRDRVRNGASPDAHETAHWSIDGTIDVQAGS